ncbi:MAG: RIP metalloprotease RseP [Syntrophorhabdaceae bacterium]|nr:RIP metalloprotease RseP [Syntrophorhabdales bacterium]MBP9560418.1 RIP metalloprotease RseP [Syntrophorhabdaceae bacterium]
MINLDNVLSIIYGIIALSLLIFVHELGHFIVARLSGVKVLAFSLGFGKKLVSIKRGETEYAISAVPLGGYVKLLGESPDDEVKEEEMHRAYTNKPPFIKILIAFTGPFFNIVLAFILFYVVFVGGYNVLSTKVGSVEKGYPAYEAGIQQGDVIIKIDGEDVSEWGELMEVMSRTDKTPLRFTIKRDEKILDLIISPRVIEGKNIFGETIKRRVIGVTASNEFLKKKESPIGAIPKAVHQTYFLSKVTVLGIIKLIEGSISPKQIGGPLMILEVAGKQAKEGKKNLIYFVAIISINLAIINLLPIPILDGGHILFHLIELATRRRVSQRFIDISQKIGMGILIAIMALAFFNDITRMFFGR